MQLLALKGWKVSISVWRVERSVFGFEGLKGQYFGLKGWKVSISIWRVERSVFQFEGLKGQYFGLKSWKVSISIWRVERSVFRFCLAFVLSCFLGGQGDRKRPRFTRLYVVILCYFCSNFFWIGQYRTGQAVLGMCRISDVCVGAQSPSDITRH